MICLPSKTKLSSFQQKVRQNSSDFLLNMTSRKINKAIAEHLGWKELSFVFDRKHIIGDRPSFHNGKIVSYIVDQYVPDYCNDLNAMHEAEKMLSAVNKNDYLYYLEDVCKTDCWTIMNSEERFRIVNAAAKQRAEAFLRTINKWKES